MWNALHVAWRREAAVSEYLVKAGVAVFCPTVTEMRRTCLRGGSHRVDRVEVLAFPRYLFVKTLRLWEVVSRAPERLGKIAPVSMGGEPVPVRDSVLAALGLAARACRFQAGRAYLGAGALEGLVIRVESINRVYSHGEVTAWLEMFGSRRLTPVAVDLLGEEVLAA